MDESCQILNPRRILTCPETILDVVLETPDNIDCDPESTTAENSADISQPSPVAESDEGSVLINAAAENMKVPNQEDPNSQYNQGTMYYSGNGIPQDYSKAWEWCLKTANQGYANAQFSLGFMFSNGKGVPQDYPKAMGGYFKAADQGHINSQNREGWV
ncbi:hypothetical protein BGZ58_007825 [Dissophora ornata]|nr:hypothetical protein BGZ58_007825 [Dissophora ornata]